MISQHGHPCIPGPPRRNMQPASARHPATYQLLLSALLSSEACRHHLLLATDYRKQTGHQERRPLHAHRFDLVIVAYTVHTAASQLRRATTHAHHMPSVQPSETGSKSGFTNKPVQDHAQSSQTGHSRCLVTRHRAASYTLNTIPQYITLITCLPFRSRHATLTSSPDAHHALPRRHSLPRLGFSAAMACRVAPILRSTKVPLPRTPCPVPARLTAGRPKRAQATHMALPRYVLLKRVTQVAASFGARPCSTRSCRHKNVCLLPCSLWPAYRLHAAPFTSLVNVKDWLKSAALSLALSVGVHLMPTCPPGRGCMRASCLGRLLLICYHAHPLDRFERS